MEKCFRCEKETDLVPIDAWTKRENDNVVYRDPKLGFLTLIYVCKDCYDKEYV